MKQHLTCPHCKRACTSSVIDSRMPLSGAYVRRRRECAECKGRFTTEERVVGSDTMKVARAIVEFDEHLRAARAALSRVIASRPDLF